MNNNVLEHIYITKEMAHVGSVKFQGLDKVNPREAREKFAVELGDICFTDDVPESQESSFFEPLFKKSYKPGSYWQ